MFVRIKNFKLVIIKAVWVKKKSLDWILSINSLRDSLGVQM